MEQRHRDGQSIGEQLQSRSSSYIRGTILV